MSFVSISFVKNVAIPRTVDLFLAQYKSVFVHYRQVLKSARGGNLLNSFGAVACIVKVLIKVTKKSFSLKFKKCIVLIPFNFSTNPINYC